MNLQITWRSGVKKWKAKRHNYGAGLGPAPSSHSQEILINFFDIIYRWTLNAGMHALNASRSSTDRITITAALRRCVITECRR